MAATLITLDQAKRQLKETGTLRDAEITDKMAQAEDAILLYVKPLRTDEQRDDWPWTIATVPPAVQAAILLELSNLDRNRGDALDELDRAYRGADLYTSSAPTLSRMANAYRKRASIGSITCKDQAAS